MLETATTSTAIQKIIDDAVAAKQTVKIESDVEHATPLELAAALVRANCPPEDAARFTGLLKDDEVCPLQFQSTYAPRWEQLGKPKTPPTERQIKSTIAKYVQCRR